LVTCFRVVKIDLTGVWLIFGFSVLKLIILLVSHMVLARGSTILIPDVCWHLQGDGMWKSYNFHHPISEMAITLKDVSCLMYLSTIGRLHWHTSLNKFEAIEWVVGWYSRSWSIHVRFNHLELEYQRYSNALLVNLDKHN